MIFGPHTETKSISTTHTKNKSIDQHSKIGYFLALNFNPHKKNKWLSTHTQKQNQFRHPAQKSSQFRYPHQSQVGFDPPHKSQVNFDPTTEINSISIPTLIPSRLDALTQKAKKGELFPDPDPKHK